MGDSRRGCEHYRSDSEKTLNLSYDHAQQNSPCEQILSKREPFVRNRAVYKKKRGQIDHHRCDRCETKLNFRRIEVMSDVRPDHHNRSSPLGGRSAIGNDSFTWASTRNCPEKRPIPTLLPDEDSSASARSDSAPGGPVMGAMGRAAGSATMRGHHTAAIIPPNPAGGFPPECFLVNARAWPTM